MPVVALSPSSFPLGHGIEWIGGEAIQRECDFEWIVKTDFRGSRPGDPGSGDAANPATQP